MMTVVAVSVMLVLSTISSLPLRAGYGRLPDDATRQRMSEYLLSI